MFYFGAYSQEICNNAIDDDLDGLIDYNDNDCICNDSIIANLPESLIPNPSFEEYSCLPDWLARKYLRLP